MLFEMFSLLGGIIKILIYKLIYFNRISFKSLPKMNNSFKIAIKRKIVIMLIRLKWFEIISFLGNIRMNKKIRKMKKS